MLKATWKWLCDRYYDFEEVRYHKEMEYAFFIQYDMESYATANGVPSSLYLPPNFFTIAYIAWIVPLRQKFCNHDWKDTSDGGPESGCLSGYCKKCGRSFHHQLY